MPTLVATYPLTSGTTSAATALVTASFTPAVGEVIVVKSMAANTVTPTPTGGGLTFTQRIRVSTSPKPSVTIHTAVVGSSPSAMTVSVAWSAASHRAVVVERWSSAALAATPAVNATTVGTSTAPSATVTTTAANSVVSWLDGDNNESTGTITYRSGATQEQAVSANGTFSGWWAYQTAGAAGAQTIGMTAPAAQDWAMAGVEVLDNSVVDQTATDAFTLVDDATQEVEALGQAADDTATVDDSATMDIVSQGFDAADDGTLSDDAAMLVVGQSFAATDSAVVDDAGAMLIVGQSFTVSDAATVTDAGSLRIVDSRAVLGTRALHVDFWLLDDAGEYVCPLPHVVGFSLSMIAGEPGTVNVEYAAAGINYGRLRDAVTRRRDALIAIRIDGTDGTSLRARLNSRNEDRIAETGAVSFGGHFLTRRLQEIVVGYQPATEKGELAFAGATAGQIMGTALVQAQDRGTGTELSFTFTNSHDSNGLPWPLQTSVQISPGMKLLDLAAKLREWGMAETEVTSDFEVRMYVPESVGIDWSLGDRPVILRRGRDLTEATRQVSTEDAPTDLLLSASEGMYEALFDETARAERGRQIEHYDSQGNIADYGSLHAYGELELSRRVAGTESNTFAISFRPDQALPLRDLHVSDWVLADTGEGIGDADRIMQLTVERQSGDDFYSGSVVVNDLIAELDVLLSRRIDGLIGGATIAGTSASSPAFDDGRAPNVPTGLGAISLAYYDGTNPKATLQASWAPVITNDDGSPISDLSGYRVQYRYAAGQGMPTDWVTFAITSNTTATTDGLTQGLVVDVRVLAVDRFERDSAWSGTYTLITASDADAPPTPSAPVVESYLGILTFAWDGKGASGEDLPGDFSHIEIHASQVSGFTPDRPVLADGTLDAAASSTYIDRLTGAGTMPSTIGTYGDTWFGKLVAVDRTGNASAASGQDSAVLVQAGDGDLSALNVGKLTSGLMTAFVANLGMIYGGNRAAASYELDPAGLRFYDANHNMTIELNRATASAFLTGTFQTGRTGRRIKIDGASNDIIFYPQAGETRQGRISSFIPSNFPNDISIAVEASDSDTLNIRGRVEIRPDVALMATVLQADTTRAPSIIGAEYRHVFLATRDDAGSDFSELHLRQNSIELQMQTAANRDGGYVWLGRGNTGATVFGRKTGAVDQALVFSSNNLDFDFINEGFLKFRVGRDGVQAPAYYGFGANSKAVLAAEGPSAPVVSFRTTSADVNVILDCSTKAPVFVKNFVINHPQDEDRYLVHACTETPEAAVEYAGTAFSGEWGELIEVELPSYFEAECEVEHRQVWLQPMLNPEAELLPFMPRALPSYPKDGKFYITNDCAHPGIAINWKVKAVRKDVPQFPVEPLKSDSEVRGDGPYTYFVAKESA